MIEDVKALPLLFLSADALGETKLCNAANTKRFLLGYKMYVWYIFFHGYRGTRYMTVDARGSSGIASQDSDATDAMSVSFDRTCYKSLYYNAPVQFYQINIMNTRYIHEICMLSRKEHILIYENQLSYIKRKHTITPFRKAFNN